MAIHLPVRSLSASSLRTLRMCPRRWKFQYVDRVISPPSGAMIAGSAVGAAANATDHHYIETGEFLPVEAVLDVFGDEWSERIEREGSDADWGTDEPGQIKDATAAALADYLAQLDRMPRPIAVEREARIEVDGANFVAYLDREQEDGSIADRKLKGKRMGQADADADSQATAYLAVRQVEAVDGLAEPPTRFEFHTLIRQKTKGYAEVVGTERSPEQLDAFVEGIVSAAREIEWRAETENWPHAPDGAWWCSERWCAHWDRCPGGGLLRRRAAQAGRAG